MYKTPGLYATVTTLAPCNTTTGHMKHTSHDVCTVFYFLKPNIAHKFYLSRNFL